MVYQNETAEPRLNQTDKITEEPQQIQTASQKTKLRLAKEEKHSQLAQGTTNLFPNLKISLPSLHSV